MTYPDRWDHRVMSEPDSNPRRTRVLLGVVGLAAVLGAGAYLITAQVIDHRSAPTSDTGALAPMVAPASAEPSAPDLSAAPLAGASPSLSTSAASPSATRSAALAPTGRASVDEEIRKAREKAAKDGYPVQRALTPAPHAEIGPVTERSVARPNGGSLRVITARFDLSGQRELLWAADPGR